MKPRTKCKLWTGATQSSGYGAVRVNGRVCLAHVAAWEAVHGPVPAGYEIHHRCEVPLCVRVDHLEALTHVDHVRISGGSKLSLAIAREVRASDEKNVTLAARYGVCDSQISRIRSNQIWKEAA